MAEFMSLKDAVATHLSDGMMAAFEGFTHLMPYAAAHEVIRQQRRDLVVVRMTPDVIYDQMIGMGCVARMIFSYAGNPGVGLLRRLRDSLENGWPHRIEIVEHSHAALAHAYEAGASKLPFAVLRGYVGADLPRVNPQIREVTCPFTGQVLAAVPAINPDVSFIHALKADRKGNVLIEGIVGVQKEAVLAARAAVVTVEEIVDSLDSHPNALVLPHWTVDAIAHVPGGAHPSYAHGYYARDNAAYIAWDQIAAVRGRFLAWMDEHVLAVDETVFANRVTWSDRL
ncbi:MAG: 3-oxoadipate--succinyl-CoA transferase subunit A [SAR116 cluster bacterium]|nr:3-oxoadipate--succinyl-CoA transferase subunit A [SAR116 cluster bacterium]RPG96978.1 MAG: CoA transferase subunit A [Candidatus Puniceispirillum sp. TMED176]